MMYLIYFPPCRGLWVRMVREACWLVYCKIRPDVDEHPGTSSILHFTYYVPGHTKSFSGTLNSKAVWRQEVYLPFHTIGTDYSGGSCVNTDSLCWHQTHSRRVRARADGNNVSFGGVSS